MILTADHVLRAVISAKLGEVHPAAPGRDRTITQFPVGKVGVYSRFFDYCGYRIPFTKFFMAVLKYFCIHISQLSPFGAARVSHFEILTRVLNLASSVTVFGAFYTRTYSGGLFSFVKRSPTAPSCFPKPPDSIKDWDNHFFWVDSHVFPISVRLYRGALEKDPAPRLSARQEETVQTIENHKAPFRRYPECFLCLVGLSPYYPFDENSYPVFENPDGSDMGLFDFIQTVDPQKVRAVEVQKREEQVTLLESTEHLFVPLVAPAAGGSGSAAAAEVPAPVEERQEDAYLELVDSKEAFVVAGWGKEEVVVEQPKKNKNKRLVKQSETLPAKRLRHDHPSLSSGTGGKTLASLEQIMPAASHLPGREQLACPPVAPSSQASEGPSQLEESEESDDSFYEPTTLNPSEAKRCYDQLYTEFNIGAARQVCLGAEVRLRAEHELELKEKLGARFAARGELLRKKDSEILKLKTLLAEKEVEAAEAVRLHDQVASLSGEKSALTAEVSVLKATVGQKDHDISLLDSRALHLEFLTKRCQRSLYGGREQDHFPGVSSLRASFQEFKEKMEVQQEEHAQALYNRVAELEAHVTDVSGRLEGEFYPAYLTTLAGRRWMLTHGIQLALLKCFKSPEYQGVLGHALGRAVDFGMQEGLEAGHEHGAAGRDLSEVDAYNPGAARASYIDAVRAPEDMDYPLVNLLRSKKDAGMDEVLDCFLLDGPLASLPEAASLQPCIEQLTIPIHHGADKAAVRETSLSFALMNVHARAEGAKRHAAALRKLIMDIVSNPLSFQDLVGEASTSRIPLSVEDYDEEDTDEALGSVVSFPELERRHV
ncbi:hypothetical protein Tco_0816664 [Tanacetum coccineum]